MPAPEILPADVLQQLLAAGPTDLTPAEMSEALETGIHQFEPSAELLQRAVNAVFWASLTNEEGRPALTRVRFSVARDPYCQLQPIELSASTLRKLSPLLDDSVNALLVDQDGMIVGVGDCGDFAIVASRPGRLAILRGSVVLGVLEQGEWVVVGGNRIDVDVILKRVFDGAGFEERFFKADLLIQCAMRARHAQRGAAFVVIPSENRGGIGCIEYPVTRFAALPETLTASRAASACTPSQIERDRMRKWCIAGCSITAAGAGMDGATLIDANTFHLLGFGAKIDAVGNPETVDRIEPPKSWDRVPVKIDELGGMRHQSAARLVQTNNSAIVVTVSQDGPVSLFLWDESTSRVLDVTHLDRYLEEVYCRPGHP